MRESVIEQTTLPSTFKTPFATRVATAAIRRDLKVFPNPNKPSEGFSKPSDWRIEPLHFIAHHEPFIVSLG